MSGTFNVRNPDVEQRMRDLADRLTLALEGTGFGFALFLVKYGAGGELFYISSAERDSMAPAIEEWCKRQKQ